MLGRRELFARLFGGALAVKGIGRDRAGGDAFVTGRSLGKTGHVRRSAYPIGSREWDRMDELSGPVTYFNTWAVEDLRAGDAVVLGEGGEWVRRARDGERPSGLAMSRAWEGNRLRVRL